MQECLLSRFKVAHGLPSKGSSEELRTWKSLNVDKSTVSRIVSLYEYSGDIAPKRCLPNSGTHILTELDKL